MAKKSKRSRGGSSKKKNRGSQAPLSQQPRAQSSAGPLNTAEARNLRRDSSAPDSGPESTTRTRSSANMLPPPREPSSDPNVDEISIPPVTSPPMPADLEDSFFGRRATVEKAAAHTHEEEDLRHSLDPRSAQKMTAEAKARRQHLQRYVKWSVGAAAAIVALAMIRVGTRGKPVIDPPPPIVHTAFAATAQEPAQHEIQGQPAGGSQPQAAQDQPPQIQGEAVAQNAPPAQAPVQAPIQAADTPASKPADAPAQPSAADPASQPVAAGAAAAAAAPQDAPAKSAAQEKKDATRFLERGKNKDAIEAGERSVALDATDGEAWLILGAAYQAAGKNADARHAFTSCVKEAKHGPISECKAMLQ